MMKMQVNGSTRTLQSDPATPLLWVLRDELKLTGTKYGCGVAQCGVCTVHVGGQATRACVLPCAAVAGRPVRTIESLTATPQGRRLYQAWIAHDVPQCGYCQSGQLMSALALLTAQPKPTDKQIDEAMSGNLCRCGTYARIRQAIKTASTA
jgi:isoquinoline 1-oxidoreductase subunit alpha